MHCISLIIYSSPWGALAVPCLALLDLYFFGQQQGKPGMDYREKSLRLWRGVKFLSVFTRHTL